MPYIGAGLGFLATQNDKLMEKTGLKPILEGAGEAIAERAKEAGNAILEGVKMGYETAKDLANGDGFAGPAQQSGTQSESSSTPAPADPGGSGPKKDDGKVGYDNIPDEMKRQVPKEWGKGGPARESDEWRWINPKNSTETVRYSKAKPNSPHSSQRQPYVKQTGSDGQPLDINGNRIKGRDGMRPSQTPGSHIPASQWKFKP